jgi:hypothetical protein
MKLAWMVAPMWLDGYEASFCGCNDFISLLNIDIAVIMVLLSISSEKYFGI